MDKRDSTNNNTSDNEDSKEEERPRPSKILRMSTPADSASNCQGQGQSQEPEPANGGELTNQPTTSINPLTIDCILDVLFSHMKYNVIKNSRLICKKWDEIGLRTLSKKTIQPIVFCDFDDFEPNGKLDKLVNETVNRKLFTSFKFEVNKLQKTPTQDLEKFVRFFQPHQITIEGEGLRSETSEEKCSCLLQDNIYFLLTNISQSIRVFEFNAKTDPRCAFKKNPIIQEILASTSFPHLRKLAFEYSYAFENELLNTCFASLIGPNSPCLKSLIINIPFYEDKAKFVDHLEKTGLASKLEELEIVNISHELIDSLFTVGQKGLLKLKKLAYNFDYTQVTQEWSNAQIKFFSTQSESLEDLHLQFYSVIHRCHHHLSFNHDVPNDKHPYQTIFELQERANKLKNQIMGMVQNMPLFIEHQNQINLNQNEEENMLFRPVQFPVMKKIQSLTIDNLKACLLVFKTLHFSSMFPSLREFKTSEISTLTEHCKGGELIKKLTLFREWNQPDFPTFNLEPDDDDDEDADKDKTIDFVHFGKFFPNLEYIELPGDLIPPSGSVRENISYWMELKGIIVVLKLNQLMALNFELMKVVKHFEIVVDCSNHLTTADDHQVYHEVFTRDNAGPCSYKYNLYRKQLSKISSKYSTINPHSITFNGKRFSDRFKNEFRSLFTSPVKFIETAAD